MTLQKEEEKRQKSIRLKISPEEEGQIQKIFLHPFLQERIKIMVCPGSQWVNKADSYGDSLSIFAIHQREKSLLHFCSYGVQREKKECEEVQRQFPACSVVLEKLPITVWQNVMHAMDVVIAVDSSALHLCGMTDTPSFSVFGPSSSTVFKPIGPQHLAFQGSCPYGKVFAKTCPQLRTCPTGACMKNLQAKELASDFLTHYHFLE